MKKVIALILTLAIFTSMLAACSKTPSSGNDDGTTDTGNVSTDNGNSDDSSDDATTETAEKEAPMLAEQVKAGTLPALEERLPIADDVMVEPDVISLGKYGGSLTSTMNDAGHWGWGPYTEQSMFRFKQDGSGQVEANVCKDFYANDDATVWTIELREGMKWSDGHPFTADDIIFYYDHMSTPALNPDRTAIAVDAEGYYPAYTSKPYNCYQVDVNGVKYWAKFDKVDDYTFTVTFAAPKPDFPVAVAVDNKWMFLPKHFYVNYVARKDGVADDATFPLITEEQAIANANKDFGKQWEDYSTMGKDIGYYNWDYAIVPQIRSFIAVKDNWNTVGETYELVRNPYFWKVDSEGRQLPYLDSIKFQIINDNDQIVLKQTAGEIDLSTAGAADFATVATATQASHTPVQWIAPDWSTGPSLSLCQTVMDLDKRALFQDKRFREALSISVDRNLMNATLMNGQSKPAQSSVPEGALGYDPEWQSKWTEYDIVKANSLLDEITEPWDGKEGTFRKMKGTDKDVEIVISIADASNEGDQVALLQSAFKTIGVKLSSKVDADIAKSILVNDIEAKFEGFSVTTPAIRPDAIVPMRNFNCWYGAYGKWYEDGKSTVNGGIEPTGDMLELTKAYEAIKNATGATRDQVVSENVQKIYDLHKENIWVIAFLAPLPMNWIVSNNVKNFPSNIVYADEYRFASMMRPEQLYLENPNE
ncbi:MAG: extracellular solute-binding protein family 5 [Herbinix sp.]|jgi:peptide/nickel transport system substrate-binding protein|nr:extracellular solute-binding protein family 5 [Herbinix sp.]